MKCKVFSCTNTEELEEDIKNFIRDKENAKISFSIGQRGYSFLYSAIVYW